MNTKLSTLIYNLQSQYRTKVILFTENDEDSSNEVKLKKAIERLLGDVNIKIQDYEVVRKEELSSNAVIRNVKKEFYRRRGFNHLVRDRNASKRRLLNAHS